MLAQRLGLIPLAIDPRKLDMKQSASASLARVHSQRNSEGFSLAAPDEPPTDLNTVVFSLIARCERRKDVKKGETDPHQIWTGVEGAGLRAPASALPY